MEAIPMSDKIKMTTPLVEMDGDEMTRILWQWIKDILITPYVELNTEYYDLGLEHREATKDQVTFDSAEATKKYGVAVKCATITPNAARMPEYNLSQMWKSPNGTIRAILDGTVFRTPILVKGITPYIPTWTKPITIARHAYGDVYKNTELKVARGSKAELVVTAPDGTVNRETIYDFQDSDGIVQGLHNKANSIAGFARACFNYGLDLKQDVWFATKDTISKKYDHTFKDIFQEVFDNEYKERFAEAGITYFYTLIDDAVARVIRSNGGYIWACKNYDGDVMSDMVSTAYGSLAMMTSVLVSPDGIYEYEAAHGTVQRHYYKHLKGEETSTNSVATIFAWSGALRKRGELDGIQALSDYADKLERATIQTIEDGVMTGDLYLLSSLENKRKVNSREFLEEINIRLSALMQ
jgi:isocitrate dehydrogenase